MFASQLKVTDELPWALMETTFGADTLPTLCGPWQTVLGASRGLVSQRAARSRLEPRTGAAFMRLIDGRFVRDGLVRS